MGRIYQITSHGKDDYEHTIYKDGKRVVIERCKEIMPKDTPIYVLLLGKQRVASGTWINENTDTINITFGAGIYKYHLHDLFVEKKGI